MIIQEIPEAYAAWNNPIYGLPACASIKTAWAFAETSANPIPKPIDNIPMYSVNFACLCSYIPIILLVNIKYN